MDPRFTWIRVQGSGFEIMGREVSLRVHVHECEVLDSGFEIKGLVPSLICPPP